MQGEIAFIHIGSRTGSRLAGPSHLCSYFVPIKGARPVYQVLTTSAIMRRHRPGGRGGRHMPLTKIRQSFVLETAGSGCTEVNQIGAILFCFCRMSPGCVLS